MRWGGVENLPLRGLITGALDKLSSAQQSPPPRATYPLQHCHWQEPAEVKRVSIVALKSEEGELAKIVKETYLSLREGVLGGNLQ